MITVPHFSPPENSFAAPPLALPPVTRPQQPKREPTPLPITWARLIRLQPRLLLLERQAARVRPGSPYFWRAYESLKAELQTLVGWDVRHSVLGTSQAYEICISRILAAMER